MKILNKLLFTLMIVFCSSLVLASNQTNYTSDGYYYVYSGVNYIFAEAWGGGGSGLWQINQPASTGGGGGGAYSASLIAVTAAQNYTINVGEGGYSSATAGVASGGNDSNISLSGVNYLVAKGGDESTLPTGGAGGLASEGLGTIKFSGGDGGDGNNGLGAGSGGGGGGAGTTMAGGNGTDGSATPNAPGGYGGNYSGGAGGDGTGIGDSNGNAGNDYGGGGSGSYCDGGCSRSGGAGGDGIVKITALSGNTTFILMRSEVTGELITNIQVNITVTPLSTNDTERMFYTNGSTLIVDNMTAGTYSVKFIGTGYGVRTYIVTTTANTTTILNAYLVTGSLTSTMKVVDSASANAIEGATFTMSKVVNSSWATVEQHYTDVTGSTQITYEPTTRYRFTVSYTGYDDLIFYLDPVLLSSYNIKLTQTGTALSGYHDVDVIITPNKFYSTQQNNYTITFASVNGTLTYYNTSIEYPGGKLNDTGINANGETFTLPFNITGATAFDTVNITYGYTTTNSSYTYFTLRYEIHGSTVLGTFINNQAQRFGLGDFEAVLIATIFILLVGGAATYFAGSLAGGVVGLFLLGYFSYIGFLPLWSVIMSLLAGFVFITWRSTS